MAANNMKRQSDFTRNSLFQQGYLDEQQFNQLEDLQDDANPNFLEEIVTLFFSDSMRLISNVETTLDIYPVNFCKLDDYMHQFMGSSSSIGAKKVKEECTQFQECCKATNAEGCKRAFKRVKQEHATLKRKLDTYFQTLRQGA